MSYLINKRFLLLLILSICTLISCTQDPRFEWTQEEGYRWAEVETDFFGSTGFEYLSANKTGIQFRNDVSIDLIEETRHYLNGSGVAVADIDGDGLQDIYFASIEGPNRLYKNLGDYKFKDVTEQSGLAHEYYSSTGVVFADLNRDRSPDLLITTLTDSNSIYLNDGAGNFHIKKDSGLGASNGAMSMSLADIDGDEILDLYITNYKPYAVKDLYEYEDLSNENTLETIDGEVRVRQSFAEHYTIIDLENKPVRVEKGVEDELYIGNGDGSFRKVDSKEFFFNSMGESIGLYPDWGLTATFRDFNNDLFPDLYVANDFWTPDRIWINRGNGTFKTADSNAVTNMSYSSMGVDFSDINRDGHLDFVVTEMLSSEHQRRLQQVSQNRIAQDGTAMVNRNSVYLNRGDETYTQIAYYSGLEASGWSWATSFMDIDLDGYEDLIIANGYLYDYLDMDTQFQMNEQARKMGMRVDDILSYPPLKLTNKIFRNNKDYTFSDKSNEWGFLEHDISQGMALVDLNNDGDMDLVFNRFNETAAIYENKTNKPRIGVKLKGKEYNTAGVGSKISLEGDKVKQNREVVSGGNYLSDSQRMAVFAADTDYSNYIITVHWASGKISTVTEVKPNRIYEIDEANAVSPKSEGATDKKINNQKSFEDVTQLINHRHHENEFDDNALQPLVPHKLSKQGPGVAWVDIDQDGHDDLFVGTGKGGEGGLFKNLGNGTFETMEMGMITKKAESDQTGITSWKEGNYTYLVVGNSKYEYSGTGSPAAVLLLIGPEGTLQEINIPGTSTSTGPLAAADIDGNGYNDLFIGGQFIPGRYPENAESRIILNNDGSFALDQMNANTFASVGLVTGAVFTDYNNDNQPDLLLSTEWGTLRLFENNDGILMERTEESGLGKHKGWWRGVATGDFNNDGRTDLVATNMGLNSYYQNHEGRPLRLYYKDFNGNGQLTIVDTYFDKQIGDYVPRRHIRDFSSVPSILNQVQSYEQFSNASVSEIFGFDFSNVPYREINTLEHMMFINTPEGFVAKSLPTISQFSAASHVGVFDYNNDGFEDLFISQNYFAFPKLEDRVDSGRGLLLKGDGSGNFEPIDGSRSGIKVYGDQRGAAISDFNSDGKSDLVVSQNDGITKLYKNITSDSGIRILLKGPDSNKDAIGSKLRIAYKNKNKGPVREIQAGSGYWSYNSKVQVMGIGEAPSHIEVIWFDGTRKDIEIVNGKMSYEISY